jgi:hypothetical protein
MLVAHTCNPSCSEGRDQEDCGSKPAQANNSQDPILKKPTTERAARVAESEGPEFKPQYTRPPHTYMYICSIYILALLAAIYGIILV